MTDDIFSGEGLPIFKWENGTAKIFLVWGGGSATGGAWSSAGRWGKGRRERQRRRERGEGRERRQRVRKGVVAPNSSDRGREGDNAGAIVGFGVAPIWGFASDSDSDQICLR
ncbi:hypothetical protein FXO38_33525 [Capsicum annuum]|nr:hypothetical protein FXO38_33525 [Capsicum annuum]